jgi:glutamate-1-semialdehyde 2,1-aminomutase
MPVGALGGRSEIMSFLAPEGSVYQAGTLSGNPLAMAAGLSTLEAISVPGFYEGLSATASALIQALEDVTQQLDINLCASSIGGMFGFCFSTKKQVWNYADVAASNESLFKRFYHGMLHEGIYFAPSMYEAGFVSAAHTMMDINATQCSAEKVLAELKQRGLCC